MREPFGEGGTIRLDLELGPYLAADVVIGRMADEIAGFLGAVSHEVEAAISDFGRGEPLVEQDFGKLWRIDGVYHADTLEYGGSVTGKTVQFVRSSVLLLKEVFKREHSILENTECLFTYFVILRFDGFEHLVFFP